MERSRFLCGVCIVLALASAGYSAELLTGEEQSFETGITPGRWEKFTWPCVFTNCAISPPGGGSCQTGVLHESSRAECFQGADGQDIFYRHVSDGAPGFGSKSVGFYNAEPGGWDIHQSNGGLRITVDVVNGETYLISGYIKFASAAANGWAAAGGLSVDTDGGTDPGAVDYGYGYDNGATYAGNELKGDQPVDTGDWMWARTGDTGIGIPVVDNQQKWFGPENFRVSVTATGDQLTLFIWGYHKFRNNMALFDGISIDGAVPGGTPTPDIPTATPTATGTPFDDFDGDGLADGLEGPKSPAVGQSNRYLPDTDGDGLLDGVEDADRSGDRSAGETSTRDRTSDEDGFEDGVEQLLLSTDPLDAGDPSYAYVDADGDGLPAGDAALDLDDGNIDFDTDRYLDSFEATMLGLSAVSDGGLKPLLGNVDGLGNVDNADSQLILNFFGNQPVPGNFNALQTDVDRNGVIDNGDSQFALVFFGFQVPVLPILGQ